MLPVTVPATAAGIAVVPKNWTVTLNVTLVPMSKPAEVALKAAQPEIMRGAQKGVLHKNAASRKVARLTKRVRAVAG